MSVASRNLFALLDDEETISTAPASAPAPKAPAPAPVKKDQPAKGAANRGGRYYQRGGGNKSAPRDDAVHTEEAATGEGVRFAEGRPERGRGRGRGRGEFRGEGGRGRGRGGARPDRHSTTGRTDTEKRINSGWGADEGRTELAAEQSGEADATADVKATTEDNNEWGAPPADTWGAPPADGGDAPADGEEKPERRQREEEEEDNTMTLTEYLAKKKASEGVPNKPEGRAANEGADSTLWKDAIQLQRDEDEDNYFVGKTKSAPKARTKKEEKVHIEIDARFPPPERAGRGRGGDRGRGDRGRAGPRGGRGRDQPRSSRGGNAVDVSDESAFPSLS